MKIFLSDMSKEIGKLSEVESFELKFKRYSIKEIEGMKFIVGEGKPTIRENMSFDKPDLLFSLINLVKGELPRYFNEPHMDTIVSDEDILKWVEIHGIPYRDQTLNSKLGDEEWRPHILNLGKFKYKLAWLYSRFTLWKAIIDEDEEKIKKYKYAAQNSYKWIEMDNRYKNVDEMTKIKLALAKETTLLTDISVKLTYNIHSQRYEFQLLSNSLMDIANFQLATLMTKERSDNKSHLKTCKMPGCNNVFWADHGNQEFCSNPRCNKRNYWYHTHRKKKK